MIHTMIPFKLVRLKVTHDGGKLTWVQKLSLAERLRGREGNHLARVTLPALYKEDSSVMLF